MLVSEVVVTDVVAREEEGEGGTADLGEEEGGAFDLGEEGEGCHSYCTIRTK